MTDGDRGDRARSGGGRDGATGDGPESPRDGAAGPASDAGPLAGTNVVLGVTGSIAAVRAVELVHELRRRGATARGVMTPAAQGVIHPWAVEFATEREVVTEITGRVEHVELCGREGWADVLLIAPATANTVGKIAAAVDDTPVTTCATTAVGAGLPVVVAPAMHEPMYDHPGVRSALADLREWGVRFVPPRIEEGKAKIATDAAIAAETARAATPDPLAGRHVVVTAGATAEAVDPVRVLTNRASGLTGRAVARACHARGAAVTLVHGTGGTGTGTATPADDGVAGADAYARVRTVESAAEMHAAAVDAVTGADDPEGTDPGHGDGDRNRGDADAGVAPTATGPDPGGAVADLVGGAGAGGPAAAPADAFVSAAAVGDFTVEAADRKIRSGQRVTLELEPTRKVLDGVREARPDLPLVAFKAETGGDDAALVEAARGVADRIGAAFVVANDAAVMGADRTRALLVEGPGAGGDGPDAVGGDGGVGGKGGVGGGGAVGEGGGPGYAEYEGDKEGLGAAVADGLVAVLD